MQSKLQLCDVTVTVVRKAIKNVHLSVHPPTGRVTIAAPERMALDTIRVFAISKLPWIRQQQHKLLAQDREPPRDFIERESHYVWGRRCLLRVIEANETPRVDVSHRSLRLFVRSGSSVPMREAVLDDWYREQVRDAAQPLIEKWAKLLGVRPSRFFVRRMRTKWGSCNHQAQTIRLNTDLAKKPLACLEYVIVHELIHLLEPTHNERFHELMNRWLPKWPYHRDQLNALPVRHEHWTL